MGKRVRACMLFFFREFDWNFVFNLNIFAKPGGLTRFGIIAEVWERSGRYGSIIKKVRLAMMFADRECI